MGGLSGAKRGRFQGGGRTMNPRAAGAAARRRNAPPQERRYRPRMDWTQMLDDYRDSISSLTVPPGGGYSGGVIPRFQTGGLTSGPPQAPSPPNPSNFRTGFEMNANIPWMPESWRNLQPGFRYSLSAHSLPKYLQHHFKTRSGPNVTDILKEQPAWWPESARGWRAWQIPRRGIEGHSVGVAPTGTRNLSGSGGRGGYSGGVIPRFQSGRTVNPRAGGAARRREYKNWMAVNNPLAPTGPGGTGQLQGPVRYPPPGGWQEGGDVELQPPDHIPPLPVGGTRPTTNWFSGADRRKRNQHLAARGLPMRYQGVPIPYARQVPPARPVPPGGWQTGGQLEEPLFPVESELADTSPWYPDEEVGYEEEAPMQGGFDIFGRGGG